MHVRGPGPQPPQPEAVTSYRLSVEVIFDIQVVFGLDDTATNLTTNSTAALLASLVGLFTRRREHSREQAREDAED
jgi:hypothetical protein